jgi:hypothetical protein
MKPMMLFLSLLLPAALWSQVQTEAEIQLIEQGPKPGYCEEPVMETARSVPVGGSPVLTEYPTLPCICYKVQVAILQETNPFNFHFHPSLVARWRPCEQVWVIESKDNFCSREEADNFRNRLRELGYADTYVTQLVTYQ